MSQSIIVDGYNLIFVGFGANPDIDSGRLESARENILQMLAKYKAVKGPYIKVVFDGQGIAAKQIPKMPRARRLYGLDVVFSGPNCTADDEIKRMVSGLENPRNCRVVSSDLEIQRFAKLYGARAVSSRDFFHELKCTSKGDEPTGSREPDEKPKPDEQSPQEKDYWAKIFGGENDKK